MAETQRTSDIYGILLDRNRPRVLMMKGEDSKWTLPHVHLPDQRLWLPTVGIVCEHMRNLLEADLTVLRGVFTGYSADRTNVELIYNLESHSEDWLLPSDARWVERGELQTLSLAYLEHRTIIDAELQEAESNQVPELRPPWARPDWFRAASTWMRQQLEEKNYVLTAPIEQTKSWGISCLLRAQTDRGNIFFKVSTMLPLFGNEPALLRALSERYPDSVPAPIAIEPEQRWMLMQDC
jgi:hypothetical protein